MSKQKKDDLRKSVEESGAREGFYKMAANRRGVAWKAKVREELSNETQAREGSKTIKSYAGMPAKTNLTLQERTTVDIDFKEGRTGMMKHLNKTKAIKPSTEVVNTDADFAPDFGTYYKAAEPRRVKMQPRSLAFVTSTEDGLAPEISELAQKS